MLTLLLLPARSSSDVAVGQSCSGAAQKPSRPGEKVSAVRLLSMQARRLALERLARPRVGGTPRRTRWPALRVPLRRPRSRRQSCAGSSRVRLRARLPERTAAGRVERVSEAAERRRGEERALLSLVELGLRLAERLGVCFVGFLKLSNCASLLLKINVRH